MRLYVCLLLLAALLGSAAGAQTLTPGREDFVYTGYGPLRTKPVRVFYYIPPGDATHMPVLMALHGEERDGQAYREDWIEAADRYGFMVVVPEFSDTYYPGGDGYNLANLFIDGDNPSPATLRPDSLWTFSLLDPLFEYFRACTQTQTHSYIAFAHSAGAQVLQKFVQYKPASKMKLAICANAGWYTMPDTSVQFPYGAKTSPWLPETRRQAFAANMLVFLGQLDNNPNSANLRHNDVVDSQGLYRLARGRYYFNTSKALAASYGYPFNWRLAEVAGVSHDHTKMAHNAVSYVVAAFDTVEAVETKPIGILTQAGLSVQGLNPARLYQIEVLSLEGKVILSGTSESQAAAKLPIAGLQAGVYLLRISADHQSPVTQKLAFPNG